MPERKAGGVLKKIGRILASDGFTLVELMIVVAIVSMLSSVAFFQFKYYHQKSANAAALTDIRNAKTLLEAYYADNRRYPR